MVTFDPDKKATKRTWLRRIFGLNPAADVRRARLDHRDAAATINENKAKIKKARSDKAYVKQLKKDGTLR
ncbi:hypothetical protein DMA15_03445 [Streptomyces sp. WAC 01529]|uniref:hypothetical protein n=1 Tax=Streptomyces sp. WAC 01529 TaxID=2203205 RepID=UPI000F701B7E|nr:hypothetical protein [Streptomyces sp. WAC 01529]AZM51748.1 hypothetical protein DMA15_03445 [Streptomyces sp. WAC 01529]